MADIDFDMADKIFDNLNFDSQFEEPDFELDDSDVDYASNQDESSYFKEPEPVFQSINNQPEPIHSGDYIARNKRASEQQYIKTKKDKFAEKNTDINNDKKSKPIDSQSEHIKPAVNNKTIGNPPIDSKSQVPPMENTAKKQLEPKLKKPDDIKESQSNHTVQLNIQQEKPDKEVLEGVVITPDDEDFEENLTDKSFSQTTQNNENQQKASNSSDNEGSQHKNQKLTDEDVEIIEPVSETSEVDHRDLISVILSFIAIAFVCFGLLSYAQKVISDNKANYLSQTTQVQHANEQNELPESQTTELLTTQQQNNTNLSELPEQPIEDNTSITKSNEEILNELLEDSEIKPTTETQNSPRFQTIDDLTAYIDTNTKLAYTNLVEMSKQTVYNSEYNTLLSNYEKTLTELQTLLTANYQGYIEEEKTEDYDMLQKNLTTVTDYLNSIK